jgi:hypothetical protein
VLAFECSWARSGGCQRVGSGLLAIDERCTICSVTDLRALVQGGTEREQRAGLVRKVEGIGTLDGRVGD